LVHKRGPSIKGSAGVHKLANQPRTGDEGTVLGTDSHPNPGFVHASFPVLSVRMDRTGVHGLAPAECWEPILPSGHRTCDEDFKRDLDKLLEGVLA
jgi:hypothetical protein